MAKSRSLQGGRTWPGGPEPDPPFPRVKICGITNMGDALAAVHYGADALGFVFFDKSPRRIDPGVAKEIVRRLPPFVFAVGVFVDEERGKVERLVGEVGLHAAQFHGSEPPSACLIGGAKAIKALRVREMKDIESLAGYRVSAFLLDSYDPLLPGGTGRAFNWDIAREAKRYGNVILAGGLTPENVAQAVGLVRPYGVDVSSGVESEKGIKDHEKLRLFINNAKGWMD